ncbi:hypothetical protein OESDEN_16880 [Oesophagostomum dentatum]|uniref:Uncharacterized protein n=1 Tax=Oesophagostomum dentatum TaxID=61180 RepID=A0A0B1SDN1_OESDE|nr:hypothetical protein OESDEN_16880 [Oesophagostomum dentatum]
MKKLAMVQDPTIQRSKKEANPASSAPPSTSLTPAPAPPPPPPPPQPTPVVSNTAHQIKSNPEPPFSVNSTQQTPNGPHLHSVTQSNTVLRSEVHSTPSQPTTNGPQQNGHEVAAPYTPNISKNAPELLPPIPQQSNPSPAAELDNVLEEVAPTGIPPRPPSRYSVQDVRMKFQKPPELPEQIKSLIDEVARRASPAPDSNERRLDLEERQERLAEKQRQLRSQFQQLQQMTPLP